MEILVSLSIFVFVRIGSISYGFCVFLQGRGTPLREIPNGIFRFVVALMEFL